MTDPRTRLGEAVTLQKQGNTARARTICLSLLAEKSIHAETRFLLSLLEMQDKNYDDALYYIDAAIASQPHNLAALNNRGAILRALGRHAQALETYDRILAIKPDHAEALSNRGNVMFDLGRYDDAIAAFDAAFAANPGFADALTNKANTLFRIRRFDDAWAANQQALKVDPGYSRAWFGLGTILAERGENDAAIAHFDRALASWPENPDAHFNKSLCLLRKGDFENGLPAYEYRWKKKNFTSQPPSFTQPRWTGAEDLTGKTILLYCEQGFGDTIQFLRYIPHIRAAKIVLEVQEPLLRLTQANFPDATVIPQGAPLPDFDYHCAFMSLPLAMGVNIDNAPYLAATPRAMPPASKPRIGIVWAGRPTHRNDINRSIPLPEFAAIFSDDFDFISLQKDRADNLSPYPQVIDMGTGLHDFADTAQIIMALDLVVAVDTSVVHLAGALGKPVWVLVPAVPDWRWLLHRADSPWYPSMRLYRQPAQGDWQTPLTAIKADLKTI